MEDKVKKIIQRRIVHQINRRTETKTKRRKQRAAFCQLNAARNKKGVKSFKIINQEGRVVLTAPKNFSILENSEELILFFKEFRDAWPRVKNGFFMDMSGVEHITGEAIMYMLSMFKRFNGEYPRFYNVKGNLPNNESARNLLLMSGFTNYMNIRGNFMPTKSNSVIQIREGQKVKPQLAGEVVHYINKCLSWEPRKYSRQLYGAIIECMYNTRDHAYIEKDSLPYWYLMTFFDETTKEITFIFLDLGVSIPATVNRKVHEKIFEMTNPNSDVAYVLSALQGKIKRTRTRKSYRGKGLPALYACLTNKHIKEMTIISRRSFIRVDKDDLNLKHAFLGTMVVWKIDENCKGALP